MASGQVQARVVAVVVTWNRKELLVECLEALAAQTVPVEEVVLVDNASTDGTAGHVSASGIEERLAIRWLRVARNGGGAEGFHYGVREALNTTESEWLWLMDDDCAPDPDALEQLLRAPAAGAPETTLLAPAVLSADRDLLPLNRGRVRGAWFLAPLVALTLEEHRGDDVEIDFCTFVGPLIRTRAARTAGLPMREMFIRNDDVEYCLRLAGPRRMWLVTKSRIVHKDPVPFVDAQSFVTRVKEFLKPSPLAAEWKHLYALRNLIFLALRHGVLTRPQAVSFAVVQVTRRLLLSERRLRGFRLAGAYARDGFEGRFRNVTPGEWKQLVAAEDPLAELREKHLRYDRDVTAVAA